MTDPILSTLASVHTLGVTEDELKFTVIVGGIALIAVLGVLRTVRRIGETQERERTKREIAAYVAEGSMTPDDATRILSAGMNEAVATELARGVTWGMVSASKAQKMVQALQQAPAPGAAPGVAPPPR